MLEERTGELYHSLGRDPEYFAEAALALLRRGVTGPGRRMRGMRRGPFVHALHHFWRLADGLELDARADARADGVCCLVPAPSGEP